MIFNPGRICDFLREGLVHGAVEMAVTTRLPPVEDH